MQNQLRQQFENPDKKITGTLQDTDPVFLIEKAAKEGTWVLVSTVRFPQFWKRMCEKLHELEKAEEIHD